MTRLVSDPAWQAEQEKQVLVRVLPAVRCLTLDIPLTCHCTCLEPSKETERPSQVMDQPTVSGYFAGFTMVPQRLKLLIVL